MCGIFVFQLFYVNKFYIPTMLVPRTIPKCAAWTDDLMKKMVHAELQDYGDFGLVDIRDKIFFQHFLLFSLKNNFFKIIYSFYYFRFRKMKGGKMRMKTLLIQ